MREPDEWNDGYILEGMDRCHTIMLMIEELLSGHPSVVKTKNQWNIDNASKMIMSVYQDIGSLREGTNNHG